MTWYDMKNMIRYDMLAYSRMVLNCMGYLQLPCTFATEVSKSYRMRLCGDIRGVFFSFCMTSVCSLPHVQCVGNRVDRHNRRSQQLGQRFRCYFVVIIKLLSSDFMAISKLSASVICLVYSFLWRLFKTFLSRINTWECTSKYVHRLISNVNFQGN